MPRLTKKAMEKRLTENEKGSYSLVAPEIMNFITRRGQEEYLSKLRSAVIDKLGKLEDLEEALGIDLVTLFEALKQGRIWIKKKDQIISSCNYGLCLPGIGYYLICKDNGYWLPVKDYGRTWALTKEELE